MEQILKNIICIIIPVLNEEKNIKLILKKIFNKIKTIDILFIDDNSKDNSRKEIKKNCKKYKNIFYIFRDNVKGIGSAHKEGIKWCYKKKYETIITMDCDGTHDPKYIPKLLNKSKKSDLVLTTRFKSKNSLRDWPIFRKFLTYLRLKLTKLILNMDYDASGAYRCFKTKKIKLKDLTDIESDNYDYFLESVYILSRKNYIIREIPINLPFRKLGKSKMTIRHIFQSLTRLIALKIK